jgi:hypothetical protein
VIPPLSATIRLPCCERSARDEEERSASAAVTAIMADTPTCKAVRFSAAPLWLNVTSDVPWDYSNAFKEICGT